MYEGESSLRLKALRELDQWISDLNRSTGLEPPLEKMPAFNEWLEHEHGGTN